VPGSGLTFVTIGDPSQRTGGYLYNAQVLGALRERGAPDGGPVDQVVIPVGAPVEALRNALERRCSALVVLDSIAMEPAVPLLDWLSERGTRSVALMHMLPSALARDRERFRQIERRFVRGVDACIAVSPAMARQLVDLGAPPERVRVVPPGRDGVPADRRHAGPPGVTRFLVVANWSPNKGIHRVSRAFGDLRASGRSAHLDLVGATGEAAYARRVRRILADGGFASDVRVWGTLSSDGLAQRYADADVFVLPSRSEGFGTVYAEALGHGLPVIAYRIEPVSWLVPEGCGILVPEDGRDALGAAMIRLADDPKLRRRVAARARRRVKALPTWQESGAEFCRIIADVLCERRSRGNHNRAAPESISLVPPDARAVAGGPV